MKKVVYFALVVCLLTACYNAPKEVIRFDIEAEDSVSSSLQRPYGIGYNFIVHADSLLLQEDRPMHWCQGVAETSDSLWVFRHENIVVAAITVIPEDCVDSVWVKVARDQLTMGWTHEQDLLDAASPDDPISQFIDVFSDRHVLWFLIAVGCMVVMAVVFVWYKRRIRMVLYDDIPSAYPTFLTITLTCSAWLYAYIQHFEPRLWVQFYFNPTLNPLSQSFVLCVFLFTVWALILLTVTSVSSAFEYLPTIDAVLYLFALLGICIVIYVVVSLTAWSWLCHILCLSFIGYALYRYFCFARAKYYCGNCHRKLQNTGKCPYCGAIND